MTRAQVGGIVAVIFLLVLSGCQTERAATAAGTRGPGGEGAIKSRNVKVTPAAMGSISRTVEVNGTLAAQDQVAVAFKVAGRIDRLPVDLGDTVKPGQLLAGLDRTDFDLAVAQAAAALEQARARLGLTANQADAQVSVERAPLVLQAKAALDEARLSRDRAQQMFDQKLISKADFDTADANFRIADGRHQDAIEEIRNRQATLAQRKTELQLARQRLADSELRAPIAGAVLAREGSVGQYVAPGSSVVTIVRMSPLRLQLPVPERAASGVRVGQSITLRLENDTNTYSGVVSRLSPAIDPTNRTLLVEATIPNDSGRLKPGSFVQASLVTKAGEQAIFVPGSALVVFAGIEKVFLVEEGKSVERLVRSGRRADGRIEIVEGLKAGDRVVVQPGNLVGGTPVEVAAK
ncbi:MAG: efflux RND transporter periplasmic adaptor subunit [Bryobacterales bacterium]|nr:efflux RND transporter periplasmic adaptor subunit [Bryobacterales bacterium]